MARKIEFIQVHTTVAKKSDAEKIAKTLVDKKLAACVQIIGPITSVYKWKGKTEMAKEWICTAKTKANFYKKIEKAIKEIHTYELPEIIAIPIVNGSGKYLEWVGKETL